MGVNKSQFKRILNKIDQKRLKNQQLYYERKDVMYKNHPKLQQIDERIATLSSGATRKVIESPSKRASIMATLQSEIQKLSDMKSQILVDAGYTPDYLKQIFDCEDCKDTGFLEGERCHCLKQEIINFSYDQSNLNHLLDKENFDHFSLDYYSNDIPEGQEKSPRNIAARNYKVCYDFSVNFGQSFNNLILYGQAGLGKTFLCNCIAKEVLDHGHTVIYMTAFQLFRLIETYRFHNEEDHVSFDDIQAIYDCDLLIIDDLGTELNNSFTTSELFSLINNRLLDQKPIVISTNLSPSGWTNQYSDRIVSRILGNYLTLGFVGSDIRLQKMYD